MAIVRALEAHEVGDHAGACEILLGALEADGPSERPHVCSCGSAYEHPGLLDAHQARTGHGLDELRVAA